jgi:hypothetical protein
MTGVLSVLGMAVCLAGGVSAAEDKKVQFALTGTLMGGQDFQGELGGIIGPGVRVDINFGMRFMLGPEAILVLYWSTLAPACTLNFRLGRSRSYYAGLGPMFALTDSSWRNEVFIKAHAGVKLGRGLIEAVYVAGGTNPSSMGERVGLFGLTFGFVF